MKLNVLLKLTILRRQLMLELKRLRLIPAHMQHHDEPEFNLYSDCWPMVQGAIVAGCFPGIGFVKAGSKLRKIRTKYDYICVSVLKVVI